MGATEYTKLEVEGSSYDSYPIKPKKNDLKTLYERSCRSSWLKCCCRGFAVLVAVTLVIFGVTATCLYAWTRKQVVRLTVTEPLPDFPTVDMSIDELKVVRDRATLFVDTIKAGKEVPDDLIVSQDDLNGLIGHSDYLRSKMWVDINDRDKELKVQMSLSTDCLPGGKGRFFVATESIKHDSNDEILVLLDTIQPIPDVNGPLFMADLHISRNEDSAGSKWSAILNSGEFMGWSVPDDFINQRKNLLEDLWNDPDAHDVIEVLNALSRVYLQDGQIVVQAKKDYNTVATTLVRPEPSSYQGGTRSMLRKLL